MVLLGPNGVPEGEVVPGFINDPTQPGYSAGTFPGWISFPAKNQWVALTPAKWLIPSSNGGWLRWDGTQGVIAFPDLSAGESVIPQFVRDGKLWLVRRAANGQRRVEVRSAENGTIDPSFTQGENWPDQPIEAIPGPPGTAWILGGEPLNRFFYGWSEEDRFNVVFRVDESGAHEAALATRNFLYHREPRLVAGPSGS